MTAFGAVIIHASQNVTLPLPKQAAGSVRLLTGAQTLRMPWSYAAGFLGDYTRHVGVGSELLYREASGLEKAASDADAERLIGIDAELIKETWNPFDCPLALLPYLAWAMGVNFWNDNWSETTKRNWIADQWQFKSMRGTVDGMAMVVEYAGRDVSPFGYQLLSIIAQPQEVFFGPAVSAADRLAWLENLPQLRVYKFNTPGTAPSDKLFCGSGWSHQIRNNFFMPGTYCIPSTAASQLGRAATWYEANQQPTDVPVVDNGSYYQVHLWGKAGSKCFMDGFFDPGSMTGKFLQPSDAWKRILTIEPISEAPWPIAVGPSLTALQAEPILIAEPGEAGLSVFCGSQYAHGTGVILGDGDAMPPTTRFFIPSTAKYRLFDEYAVIDPNDPPPATPASAVSFFLNNGHFGWPEYTVQANVFMAAIRPPMAFEPDGIMMPHGQFLIPHDPEPMAYVCSALEASRRMSDKILLATGPWPDFVAGAQPLIAGMDSFIVGQPAEAVPTSSLQ